MQWHGLKPIDRAPTQHTAQPEHERCSAGLPAYLSCFAPPSYTCRMKRWVIRQLDDFIPSFYLSEELCECRVQRAGCSPSHLHRKLFTNARVRTVGNKYSFLTCLLVCFLVGRSLYFEVLMYYIFARQQIKVTGLINVRSLGKKRGTRSTVSSLLRQLTVGWDICRLVSKFTDTLERRDIEREECRRKCWR